MDSTILVHILITYFVMFESSTRRANGVNIDDDGEEISMRNFIPQFQGVKEGEEAQANQLIQNAIQTGNMKLLVKLIQWTGGLQDELEELRRNVTEGGMREFHGMPLLGSTKDIEVFIDETIEYLKGYERQIEEELRKPNKPWNYPTENR